MGVLERAAQRQANGEVFALATVVRTISVTAAKAGAKALITADGAIVEGWIGGGCARAAVLKAARQSLADGQSRLVSIAPQDLLAELGVSSGEDRAGVHYAKNSCPSQGTMDIFVEPMLPPPRLLILGASPVAVALAALAPQMGFIVAAAAPASELDRFPELVRPDRRLRRPGGLGRASLRRRFDAGRRRPRRAEVRRRRRRSLRRVCRIAPQGGNAARGAGPRGRFGRPARGDQGARWPRYRRDHQRGDRLVDPGGNGHRRDAAPPRVEETYATPSGGTTP